MPNFADIMKVSFIEDAPSAIRFKVSGINSTLANSLRRIMSGTVGCFAIDKVVMYENSSAMFDEYIAHRIGLIPIITPKDAKEDEQILFNLEAEGPKIVYSKELLSTDKSVKVANEEIPIIELGEGQRLRLEGQARMGAGSESAKFRPALVTYTADENEEDYEFYVESYGQMPAKEILNRALYIINDALKQAQKSVKK